MGDGIQSMDDPAKWVLIDWEYAALLPTKSNSEETHSPSVRKDCHGAEVDIWGYLFHEKAICIDEQRLKEDVHHFGSM